MRGFAKKNCKFALIFCIFLHIDKKPGRARSVQPRFYHKIHSLSIFFQKILYKFFMSNPKIIVHFVQKTTSLHNIIMVNWRFPTSNTYFDRLPASICSYRVVIWLFELGSGACPTAHGILRAAPVVWFALRAHHCAHRLLKYSCCNI